MKQTQLLMGMPITLETEPLTAPPTRNWRRLYFALTAVLFLPQIHVGALYSTAAIPHNWPGFVGRINEQMILQAVPDYLERLYYLSGPPEMVLECEQILQRLQIPSSQIKKDFFPGLV